MGEDKFQFATSEARHSELADDELDASLDDRLEQEDYNSILEMFRNPDGTYQYSEDFFSAVAQVCEWDHESIAGRTENPELLAQLAQSEDEQVRRNVARNSFTASETLARLAQDEDLAVRQVVAGDERCPAHVLSKLLLDEHAAVRNEAAQNRSLDPADLERVITVVDADVRQAITQRQQREAAIAEAVREAEERHGPVHMTLDLR